MTGHRIHPDAEVELSRAAHWYERRRAGLGDALLAEYERVLARAIVQPRSGAPLRPCPDEVDLRSFSLRRFPYSILVAVMPPSPLVIAIAHQRRRPGYWLTRIG